jgi:hypothetical protein
LKALRLIVVAYGNATGRGLCRHPSGNRYTRYPRLGTATARSAAAHHGTTNSAHRQEASLIASLPAVQPILSVRAADFVWRPLGRRLDDRCWEQFHPIGCKTD